MAEYIERESLLRRFNIDDMMNVNGTLISLNDARNVISNFPAADVVPVRHGRFLRIYIDEYYGEWGKCSVCGWDNPGNAQYCNGCGALMDGKK